MSRRWQEAPHIRRRIQTPVGSHDRKDRSAALECPCPEFQFALGSGRRTRCSYRSCSPIDRAPWQRRSSMETIRPAFARRTARRPMRRNADRDQNCLWSGSLPLGRTSRFFPRAALARQNIGSCGTLSTTAWRATRASSDNARRGRSPGRCSSTSKQPTTSNERSGKGRSTTLPTTNLASGLASAAISSATSETSQPVKSIPGTASMTLRATNPSPQPASRNVCGESATTSATILR